MLIEQIPALVRKNKTVALVVVTASSGSTPAEPGKEMLVDASGSIGGTVGGGQLEFKAIEYAKECIAKNENKPFHFDLKKDLGMECGGSVDLFIRVYSPSMQLVLVGGGHVNHALYRMAEVMGFDVTVIDDRADIVSEQRYPNAKRLICGNIGDETEKLELSGEDYVVIATQGHGYDEIALGNLVGKHPRYIGVIGSRRKVTQMMQSLMEKGVPKEELDRVYAPVGIALGGDEPAEVALSILSEIQLTRRGGEMRHMKLQ
jgi:xanthine dehydrogenase accessory factor